MKFEPGTFWFRLQQFNPFEYLWWLKLWRHNFVHDVTNKILSRDPNYFVNLVVWLKFGHSSIIVREVIITLILYTVGRGVLTPLFYEDPYIAYLPSLLFFCFVSLAGWMILQITDRWGLTHVVFCWYSKLISHTQTNTSHSRDNRLTHPYKYILRPPAAICITLNKQFTNIKNLLSTMYFLSKNCSFVEVIYLLIRCNKTRFFLWNIVLIENL